MEKNGNALNVVTMVLTVVTLVSLLGSAMGGVIESVIPAYFWYLALTGMLALSACWIVMAVMLVVNQSTGWYRRQYASGSGH